MTADNDTPADERCESCDRLDPASCPCPCPCPEADEGVVMTRLPGVTLSCDHPECGADVQADRSNEVPASDAFAALAVCAAALGWQVGSAYSSADSFDLCPEHKQ